jgi:hypothetical protein
MLIRDPLGVKSVIILLAFVAVTLRAPSLLAAPQQANEAVSAASARATEPTLAGVPKLIQFASTLKDSAGRPVVGVASVTFAIYAEREGGTALWSETQNVIADSNGHFSALLGGATANGVPAELFGTGQSRWLGITIARMAELPRVLLASVPYALKAADADTLGGLPASAYVTTQSLASSNARATTPVVGNTTIIATPQVATSASPAASVETASNAIPQTTPSGSGTTDYIPLWTSSSALGNSILFQSGGKLGLGTTTPQSTLDINGGEILRGGFYEYPQATADEYFGQPSHSFQWMASLFDSSTNAPVNKAFGFRALPLNNDTANPGAYLDLFYGSGGPDGSLTDTYLSFSSTGVISFVPAQTFTGTSESLTGTLTASGGVDVESATVSEGVLISVGGSGADGVSARATGEYGTAVNAITIGAGGIGVVAEGSVGVVASGSPAGDFSGDVSVSGSIFKSGGSFKIDHPLDPANKYLYHSFVESPDMKNVYDGVVTTDSTGLATVTMPDWFEALNSDFRYQLTSLGQPAQTWIAKEIQGGMFTIQTDKPNVKVSWQVTGIRQDAYANAHRIPVEQEKSAAEKGHYIRPELFGHPEEPSILAMRLGAGGKLVPILAKQPSPPASAAATKPSTTQP